MRIATSLLTLLIAGTGLAFALGRASNTRQSADSEAAAFAGATMGTTYSVKVAGFPPAVDRNRVAREIQARLEGVNCLMSTYDPNSELSRFNGSDAGEWFPVSPETARVVAEAIRVGDVSAGALDVTIGPVVDLWSFGPAARPQGVLPTEEEIAAAMAAVGLARLEVRLDPPALRKRSPACRVDLSSLAKGFAVDRVAEALEQFGIDRYMVEVGGEIRTAGLNAKGEPWQIAVDPRTGRPVHHRLASVSILADTCMEADALATALFVLGPEEGLQLALARNIPALFLVRTDRGFEEYPTPTFPTAKP
jgi:thiamine biosynthesis lipoprotein